MKKLLALLLALLMVLSLAACGGDDDTEDTGRRSSKDKQTEDTTEAPVEGKALETELWTLIYDDEIWEYDDEELYDEEDWCDVSIMIPMDDGYEINVEITASIEDHADFRDELNYYGFEAEKYVDGDYDTVKVGGVDMLKYETESWGEDVCRYFNRVEGAGATVGVVISGEYDERVEQLLKGLTFNLEDTGNEDAPWPWDGQPFEADDESYMIGGYTVDSQWLPMDESLVTFETFNHSVAVVGDNAYILGDEMVRVYSFDGDSLEFDHVMDIEGAYEYAYSDESGILWLSGFMEDFVGFMDEQQVANFGEMDTVAVSPDGTWGVNWFSGPECMLLEIGATKVSESVITFEEVDTIMHLNVDNDYIYVCGSDENYDHGVFVYDTDGDLKMTLKGEDGEGLGSITFVAQFDGGFIGLDGNMREIILWDEEGNWLGNCEDSDLFGTYYPWFCGGALLDDGSIIVIMTDDRTDESAMELVAFKLSVS